MGTRMARYANLKEPKIYFLKTIGIPVLFHGTMDFYAFFAAAEARSFPILSILATPLDIVLVFFLLLLCRRYGALYRLFKFPLDEFILLLFLTLLFQLFRHLYFQTEIIDKSWNSKLARILAECQILLIT
jgi:hypothetical protein